jgi:hypothetical protein
VPYYDLTVSASKSISVLHASLKIAALEARDQGDLVAGTPRIVRVGPSSVKGTRRSFLTASQERSPGPALERRSLCRPSGPDGEGQTRGQAGSARRTSQFSRCTRTIGAL